MSDQSEISTKNFDRGRAQDLGSGVNVADVSSDTGSAGDIVESEIRDKRIELHEKR